MFHVSGLQNDRPVNGIGNIDISDQILHSRATARYNMRRQITILESLEPDSTIADQADLECFFNVARGDLRSLNPANIPSIPSSVFSVPLW